MRRPLSTLGNLATKIESWWTLGVMVAGTSAFAWLGQQWDWLASQGWAAVLIIALIITSLVTLSFSLAYLALMVFRTPLGNIPPSGSQATGNLVADATADRASNRAVYDELQAFYRSRIEPKDEIFYLLFKDVCSAIRGRQSGSPEHDAAYSFLASITENHVVYPWFMDGKAIFNIPNQSGKSNSVELQRIQERISSYHTTYVALRSRLHELDKYVAHRNIKEHAHYKEWEQYDRDYATRLREITAHPRYQVLKRTVDTIGFGDQY